jgi:cytochrome c oxidase cbb3-type subunit 3
MNPRPDSSAFSRSNLLALYALASCLSAIMFVPGAQAQEPQPSKNIVGQEEPTGGAEVAQGKALFQQKCGFCHGPDATGGEGPDLLRSSLVSHDLKGDLIGQVVREGRPAKGMPAFDLNDTQIKQIAAFIHNSAKALASLYLSSRSIDYPLERLLVGNASAGKAYFEGAGKCSDCHSATGDLSHIASRYKPLDLQSRLVFPKGAEPTITVTLTAGSRVSGKEVYADAFHVSFRDQNGWIHTFARQGDLKIQIDDPLAAHEKLLTHYTDKNIHDLFAYLETLK